MSFTLIIQMQDNLNCGSRSIPFTGKCRSLFNDFMMRFILWCHKNGTRSKSSNLVRSAEVSEGLSSSCYCYVLETIPLYTTRTCQNTLYTRWHNIQIYNVIGGDIRLSVQKLCVVQKTLLCTNMYKLIAAFE